MKIIEAGKRKYGRTLLLAFFLLTSLLITGWAALRVKAQTDENVKREFTFVCSEINDKIIDRFLAHAQLLRSAEAYFASSDCVSRQEWQSFCAHQGVDHFLQGIQGLGFALLIPRENVARHIQETRAEGFPEYHVRPEGERELYSAIIYIEPFAGRNLRAFGYDMLTEPVRRVAMEQARDLNGAVLSGKVLLVQETEQDVQAGTLMYLPVYGKNMPIETVDQRRAAIKGWVYSPYRMTDLMNGILGRADLKNERRIHLKVFDGELATPAALLYDSQPAAAQPAETEARLNFQRRVVVAERPWTLRFTMTDRSDSYGLVWLVLLGGTAISLLLAGFIFSLLNTEFKARQLALQLTQNLSNLYAELEKRVEERTTDLATSRLEALNLMEEAVKAHHVLEEVNQQLNQEMEAHQKVLQELKRSEIRYRNYFELPLHGRAITSPEKGWIEVNDRLCTMLGYSREELLQMSWSEMTYPDDLPIDIEQFERMRSGKIDQYQLEKRFVRKDGTVRWINLAVGCVRSPDGKVEYFTAVLEDITERKRFESELHKVQKLTSLGTLAGGIAHDFNNIMMGLFGNIALTKDELPPDHPARKSLEDAEKCMNRSVRLTKQLLTFAKGGDPVKEDVSLAALVEESTKFDLSGSNVLLVYQKAADLWLAKADKGQIQQVLSNLTINARQAMPVGGHLYITLQNADLRSAALPGLTAGKYIRITFRDEGTGIDPKHMNRLFDPYFTTKSAGHGLGLATAYSIITKHGGHIDVESELGNGTTFTIYLPASEQQALPQNRSAAAVTLPLKPGARILVLDDEKCILMIAVRWLKKSGYVTETAETGQQAIAMYQQALKAGNPFDVIILDLTIPGGIGGLEVLKQLQVIDPHVKALVSSGYAEGAVMSKYASYGFTGAIAKPYTESELLEVLRRVLP